MGIRRLGQHVALASILSVSLMAVVVAACRSGPGELVERETDRLEAVMKQSPNDAGARVELAGLYSEAGATGKAIRELERALDLSPSHQAALIALGGIYSGMERFAEALEYYDRVVALNEHNPMRGVSRPLEGVFYSRGMALFSLGRIEESAGSFQEALMIDRTNADSWYGLATALQRLGKHEEAIDSFREAALFVPSFLEAYQGMERSHEKLGQDSLAGYAEAMISYSRGAVAAAVEQLQTAIAEMPDFAEAYLGLGLAYESRGETVKAGEAYSEAARLDPDLWLAEIKAEALGGQ